MGGSNANEINRDYRHSGGTDNGDRFDASRAATGLKTGAVTFNKDVLPILQKNCQTCHRPGEIAPMSFLTYEDARPWAKAMKAAVVSRQMPPWFADPSYGHFANDRRLSDSDIKTLSAWADGGASKATPKTSRRRSPSRTDGTSSRT